MHRSRNDIYGLDVVHVCHLILLSNINGEKSSPGKRRYCSGRSKGPINCNALLFVDRVSFACIPSTAMYQLGMDSLFST